MPVRFTSDAMKGQVLWLSPQQYLDLSPSMKDPEAGDQAKKLRESLENGEPIHTPPSLTIKDGKVTAQDGRHRAFEAKRDGIKLIPVRIDGQVPDSGKLVGMMGKTVDVDKDAQKFKTWGEIAKSKEFRKLDDDAQEQIKRQYFDRVVRPRISPKDVDAAAEQFQTQTGARVPPTQYDPTEGMSGVDKFLAGMGKSFHDIDLGVRSMLPENLGGTTPDEVAEARHLDAALMATGAGKAGNIAGNVALAAPTALVPGANTVTGSALMGAIYGALQPAETWSERGSNALEGGLVSGGVTAGMRAVPTVYRALVSPFTSSGQDRIALDTIGRFAKDPNVLSKPMGPAELIPGSKASLAEVTGDPGIAQLQRAAQAASKQTANAFAEVKTGRLAARKNALLTIAGQQGEKESLEAARDAAAKRLYGQAFGTPIDAAKAKALAPEIKALMARPSIQEAQQAALKLAKEEGEILKPADFKGGSVKGMHYMKLALDDQIAKAKAAGNRNLARALTGTQEKLLKTIDELSPAYKDARAEYAKGSKPINRAEIGRYLYDKLVPALTDLGAERQNPQKFAEALKEGDELARKATGMRGAKLRDVLTPDDTKLLVNLGLDLGRETKAIEAARVPGSPTAQYLAGKNALRSIAGPLGMPQTWAESLLADTVLNRWVSAAVSPVENRVQQRLGMMLTDPAVAAKAAAQRQAAANTIPMSALGVASRRGLPPMAVGGSMSYLANASAEEAP